MDAKLRKRIVDRHSDSLLRFGYHPNALYWSNVEIQELRFKVLAEVGVQSGDSVLDVGCGFADLKGWFTGKGMGIHYTGVDISPDLIGVAKQRHPTVELFVGELADCSFEDTSFDWILLSGALNEPYGDEGKYAKSVISTMYALARKGVAFNLLNRDVIKAYDLQSFNTDEMLQFCRQISHDAQLRTDYLANDFTIYMRK
ncbi:MAG: class I SAM-dependent methyltransferase [Ghiorsea sp.]